MPGALTPKVPRQNKAGQVFDDLEIAFKLPESFSAPFAPVTWNPKLPLGMSLGLSFTIFETGGKHTKYPRRVPILRVKVFC